MNRFLNGLWVVSMNRKIATFDRDEFIERLRRRASNFLLLENSRKMKERYIYIYSPRRNLIPIDQDRARFSNFHRSRVTHS